MEGLSARMKAFCEHYAKTGNGSDSARRAGYQAPVVEASRLLRKPKVVAYIETLKAETPAEPQRMDDKRLLGVLEGFAQDEALNAPHRLKAIELLMKARGLLTPETTSPERTPAIVNISLSGRHYQETILDVDGTEIQSAKVLPFSSGKT